MLFFAFNSYPLSVKGGRVEEGREGSHFSKNDQKSAFNLNNSHLHSLIVSVTSFYMSSVYLYSLHFVLLFVCFHALLVCEYTSQMLPFI